MRKSHSYYNNMKKKPLAFENIDEKQLIHQFDSKNLEIELEKLDGKKKLNEIR